MESVGCAYQNSEKPLEAVEVLFKRGDVNNTYRLIYYFTCQRQENEFEILRAFHVMRQG